MKGFRLNGGKFSPKPLPRMILRIIALLDALPDGDLLGTPELAQKTGYVLSGGGFSGYKADSRVLPYRALIRYPSIRLVWGNKKTIAKLSKHKEILA